MCSTSIIYIPCLCLHQIKITKVIFVCILNASKVSVSNNLCENKILRICSIIAQCNRFICVKMKRHTNSDLYLSKIYKSKNTPRTCLCKSNVACPSAPVWRPPHNSVSHFTMRLLMSVNCVVLPDTRTRSQSS